MARQHILVVDDDTKSLQVLEISLKKAGYLVTTATNGLDALEKAKTSTPELIISDVKMPKMNGFQFCQRIKDDPRLKDIPFIFLSSQRSIDDKVRGLELGVDDYLTKPIYIKELLARVKLLLKRKEKDSLEQDVSSGRPFSGSLADMGVVDLLQTLEIGRKTGVLYLTNTEGKSGLIYFREGRVIDALQEQIKGERAVYRMLTWNDGQFRIDFKAINRDARIEPSIQGLIMEGMRRLDEWERLAEQLPALETILMIDPQELMAQYPEKFPDKAGQLLQLFDGRRTILEVVDQSGLDDLAALNIISRMYFQGLLKERDTEPAAPATPQSRPQPAAPMPPMQSFPPKQPVSPAPPVAAASGGTDGDTGPGADAWNEQAGATNTQALLERVGNAPAAPTPPAPGKAPAQAPVPEKPTNGSNTSIASQVEAQKAAAGDKVSGGAGKLIAIVAAAVVVLGLGTVAGLGAIGIGPATTLFKRSPDLAPLLAQLGKGTPEALGALIDQIEGRPAAERQDPGIASIHARALLHLGRAEGTLKARLPEADAILRDVPGEHGANPWLGIGWAEVELAGRGYEPARNRLEPLLGHPDQRVAAEANWVMGLCRLEEGRDMAKAIDHLNAAAQVMQKNGAVELDLARALLTVENFGDARKHAERALAHSPQLAGAHLVRAQACEGAGDRECAAESWMKGVSMAPGDVSLAIGRAEFLRRNGTPEEARERFRHVATNPAWTAAKAERARAYFALGEMALADGIPEQARDHFEQVRALQPDYPGLSAKLAATRPKPKVDPAEAGRRALDAGNYTQAVGLLSSAIEQRPNDAQLHADLGVAFLQLDQTSAARRSFESALRIDRDNATALRWLGQIYANIDGAQANARRIWAHFLEVAPNHPDAPLVRALLRRIE